MASRTSLDSVTLPSGSNQLINKSQKFNYCFFTSQSEVDRATKGGFVRFILGYNRKPKTTGTLKWYKFSDVPGGTVVKNPPANAGDAGSIPRPGRSHIPRSN